MTRVALADVLDVPLIPTILAVLSTSPTEVPLERVAAVVESRVRALLRLQFEEQA